VILPVVAAAVDFTPLDATVRAELERTRTPGAAVAVVIGDQVAHLGAYGTANIDTGEPVRPDMLFRLGSTTKMMTAAAVASLVEDGKLKLDAPIGGYDAQLPPHLAPLTLRQLLSHTAGLGDLTVMDGLHDESALAVSVRALPPRLVFVEPRRIYSYSNPGYWIAGHIAAQAGGEPYADVVARRVLQPLGMTRSTLRPTVAITWPVAVGHGPESNAPPIAIRPAADNAGAWPAGQLYSSAPEFARFCIAFMNGGTIEGKQALSVSLIQALSTPVADLPGTNRRYALGLAVAEENGVRWLSHTGSRTGFGSQVRMAPDRRFAVVILCNKTGQNLPRVAEHAAQLALGIAPPERDRSKPQALDAEQVRRLAGVYSNGVNTMQLTERDGELMHRLGPVKSLGADRLLVDGREADNELTLVKDASGAVEFILSRGRAFRRR
jgi:CubicO group peptidase (beta-lactamase class C family)